MGSVDSRTRPRPLWEGPLLTCASKLDTWEESPPMFHLPMEMCFPFFLAGEQESGCPAHEAPREGRGARLALSETWGSYPWAATIGPASELGLAGSGCLLGSTGGGGQ